MIVCSLNMTEYKGAIHISSTEVASKIWNSPYYHPLVAVMEFNGKGTMAPCAQAYGFYTLILRQSSGPAWRYGENSVYRSQNGSVIAFAPGQYSCPTEGATRRSGIALLFKTDLLRGTVLGQMIWKYAFFHYNYNEALFLSDAQRRHYILLMNAIKQQIEQDGPNLNLIYITQAIKQVLDLLQDVYKQNASYYRTETDDMFCNYEYNLMNYILGNKGLKMGLPTVEYFANLAGVTANHFGDKFKDILGINPKFIMNMKMRAVAMERLLSPSYTIRQVSESLGFVRVAHFSRFFRNITGMSPSQYIQKRKEEIKLARNQYKESDKPIYINLSLLTEQQVIL